MIDCPYCSLAKKKGQLFCSRHSDNMNHLESGVFFIEEKSFEECDWHMTRLSLNFNLDDKQTYYAGNRKHTIGPDRYLLINQGQLFKTHASSANINRMITVAFKVRLPEQVVNCFNAKEAELLSSDRFHPQIEFPEKTYTLDEPIRNYLSKLIAPGAGEDYVQDEIESLLLHVLKLQLGVRKDILGIRKVRVSTREEIYKRMHWSLEYVHDNYAADISIEQLAEQSCLSSFHYKRLFREVFGVPPYQYLKKLRLEKACHLLKSELPVQDVCKQVGWKDPSSFARLFKNAYNQTPQQFRMSVGS